MFKRKKKNTTTTPEQTSNICKFESSTSDCELIKQLKSAQEELERIKSGTDLVDQFSSSQRKELIKAASEVALHIDWIRSDDDANKLHVIIAQLVAIQPADLKAMSALCDLVTQRSEKVWQLRHQICEIKNQLGIK